MKEEEEDQNRKLSFENNSIIGESSYDYDGETDYFDDESSRGESIELNTGKKGIIIEFKDHLMIGFLLLSSSVNFNILYLPFIFIGISYIFFLSKYNKRIIEIISFIYSILLLIVKVIILGLIQKEKINYDEHEHLFNNIGIRYQKDQKTKRKIFISFIGEISLAIFSVISMIISSAYKGNNKEKKNNNSSKLKHFNIKIQAIIHLLYISILINAIYNKSFLTLFYLLSYQILLIIIIFKSKSDNLFKCATFFYLICFSIQLILINIFNIYTIQEKLLKKNVINDGEDIKKVYSIWTMIGINYSYYFSDLTFIYDWISYLACVITIILMTINQNIYLEKNKGNEDNDNLDIVPNDKKEKEKICNKIKDALVNFFTNSEFLLFFIRILSIIWMSILRNFFSLGIFAFLFFSFIFDDMNNISYLVIFILIPTEFLTIGCLHLCNINGISESLDNDQKNIYNDFAYEKEEYNYKYFLIGIYFLFTSIFLNSFYYRKNRIKLNIKNPILSKYANKDENEEPLLISENEVIKNTNESKNSQERELNKKINEFGLIDLIKKLIYDNIGKLTLVTMYLMSVHTINIVHFINIILFMILILKQTLAQKYNKIIIILIQLLFLFEYLIEITKNYYESFFNDNIKLFQFLLSISEEKEKETYSININTEIFCYVSIYSFYFDNKAQGKFKDYFDLMKTQNISILSYINNKIEKDWKKKVFSIIVKIAFDIYIIGIFFTFFIICCNMEINILIIIKLFIFFFIADGYFQEDEIFNEKLTCILSINYILITYCCFCSFIVYLYQLICLDFFGLFDKIKKSNNFLVRNFPSLGLINYENKDLLLKFLPHFLSNFLPILLKNVMKFMNEQNMVEKKKDKKINYVTKDINNNNNEKMLELANINNSNENNINYENEFIINDDDNDDDNINDNEKDNLNNQEIIQEKINEDKIIKNIDKEEENNNIINGLIDLNNLPENEENDINIEEKEEDYKLKIIELKKKINSLHRLNFLYLLINFILRLYSPSMLLLFSYIFTTSKISFALIIYFIIICLNFIFMFKNFINTKTHCKDQINESINHKNISHKYSFKLIKFITYITMFFLFSSYLYSIIHDFKYDCSENKNKNKENNNTDKYCGIDAIKHGDYLLSISFILGIYDYSNISEFFDSNYIYLLLLVFIFLTKYTKMIIANLEKKIGDNREIIDNINVKMNYLNNIVDYMKLEKEYNQNEIKTKAIGKLILSHTNNIHILHSPDLKEKLVIFLQILKRIYEYFLIFAIMSCLIIKMNIWSIIYMIIIIILLIRKENETNYYIVFIIIAILEIIQCLILILNMNKYDLPNIEEKIFDILNDTLSIPLYQNYLGEKYVENGILLGVGVSRSHLLLIWNENILLVLIYIYLYYFCYNSYTYKNEEPNRLEKTRKKSKNKNELLSSDAPIENNDKNNIIFQLLKNKELRDDINKIKPKDYKKIVEIMEYNFNEKIVSYEKLQEFFKEEKEKEEKEELKNKEKDEFSNNIPYYILFLFIYNIILIIILIISMISPGFFSVIVIFFCLFFSYFCHLINEGKKSCYLFINMKLNIILRCIIIFDITLQIAIQYIVLYYPDIIKEKTVFKFIFETLGYNEIINEKYEITGNIAYLFGKSFCFFCLILLKFIYFSQSFKIYYLTYIIKIRINSDKKNSKINANIYNNELIKTMNYSLRIKFTMEKSIEKLKRGLKDWSKNMDSNTIENISLGFLNGESEDINNNDEGNFNYREDENDDKYSDSSEENEIEEQIINTNNIELNNIKTKIKPKANSGKADEKSIKIIIKSWILDQTFLIKIYSFLDKISFNLSFSSYFKVKGMKMNLLKGNNRHTPQVIKKINERVNKLVLSKFDKNEIKTLRKFMKDLDRKNILQIEQYLNPSESNNEKVNNPINIIDNNSNNDKEIKTKEKDEIKELIKDMKYKQILELKKSLLFKKYITKSYLIKKIFQDLIIIISKNFCWICYLFMIINHLINASIISMIYPLSIFCYALLENPRPSKNYWRFCYIYTFIILIIKCFSQKIFFGAFSYFEEEEDESNNTFYEDMKIFLDNYPIGIKIYDGTREYLVNLIFDFLLLICFIINQIILMLNGLWEKNENNYENIEEAMKRVAKYNNKRDQSINNKTLKNTETYCRKGKIKKETCYFNRLFPKLRNEKPGKDFYFFYGFAMILLIFYLLFFYTSMVKDKTYGGVNITTNQFNGMSIILVLIHLVFLIIDRIIYLRQNRYKVNYEYMITDKEGKSYSKKHSLEEIKKKFPEFENENNQLISYKYLKQLKEEYFVSIFQNETCNYPLVAKYILHILLTLSSHGFIFFFVTMSGNYNIYNAVYCIKNNYINECNNFQENYTIIFFYILYVFYLTFSALQIKYGFYDIKRKSIFKNVKSLHGTFFQIYKNIPFYYSLKNLIDWTVTPTSFSIFDWFKFENIHDEIFDTYRKKYKLKDTPVGQKITFICKILCGVLVSVVIILLIIVPLILFSTLNPISQINNVNSANLRIYISFIDINKEEKNILIFENNWAKSITKMTDDIWDKYNYSKSYYIKTFPREQTQIISFYSEPENSLSSFKINHILPNLFSLLYLDGTKPGNDRIIECDLIIESEFIRALPSEAKSAKKLTQLKICDIQSDRNSEGCIGLNNLFLKLNGSDEYNNTDISFNISGFSPIVRLGASTESIKVKLEKEINIPLIFRTKENNLFEIYLGEIKDDNGITFHVLNEKFSSATLGYSLIGFYTAIILVIANYVGKFYNYDPSSIIIKEMPYPVILLKICEGIKVSRYLHDFKNEEYYFNFLVEILRTPDLVKKLTSSTLMHFERREQLPE